MNETLRTILSRRSWRSYKPDQIGEEPLRLILDAAIAAPSARFRQKWHFTVVQNRQVLARIAEVARRNMLASGIEMFVKRAQDPGFDPTFGAPTVVIVSGEQGAPSIEIDCGAAAENILIAAESLGIGACLMTSSELWFASQEGEALKKDLGIPEGYRHICAITLGYKAAYELPERTRRKDVFNFVR